jgi:hypothetical protein
VEFTLLRILKGQLSYRERGLSLIIKDPTEQLLYDSIEIYEEAYDKAYSSGAMIKEELESFLFEQELYTPFDDTELAKLKRSHDELKISAYKSALNKRQLRSVKYELRANEEAQGRIIAKKTKFAGLSCEGAAEYIRWTWMIENSTFYKDGRSYNWREVSPFQMFSHYESCSVSQSEFREVARSDHWRPVWTLGKKTGNLFGKPSCELTREQLMLCSFSVMYDNVYESGEAPSEGVINDDDCLDGWFLEQKRKYEKQNKEKQVEGMLGKNMSKANDIFIFANSTEEAKEIHGLNDPIAEMNRQSRIQTISSKGGEVSDLDFQDVKSELAMRLNRETSDKIRRR